MQRWEHRIETSPSSERLAELGREGWELVGVIGADAYLRRPAPAYREQVTMAQRERALAAPPHKAGRTPAAQQRLLHPDLYRVFASAGHTDLVTICDRGFPVPLGPERIDVAVADDLPTVTDILRLTQALFPPDRLVLPEEAQSACPARIAELHALLPKTEFDFIPHIEFKHLAATTRATVRTGDSVPYGNVIWVG